MELYATKKQIVRFLRERAPEEGVSLLKVGCAIGRDWYLVMARYDGSKKDKMVKLAYNSDDLQCDYEWDWSCFINPSTQEIMGNESFLTGKEGKAFLEFAAAAFISELKAYERIVGDYEGRAEAGLC